MPNFERNVSNFVNICGIRTQLHAHVSDSLLNHFNIFIAQGFYTYYFCMIIFFGGVIIFLLGNPTLKHVRSNVFLTSSKFKKIPQSTSLLLKQKRPKSQVSKSKIFLQIVFTYTRMTSTKLLNNIMEITLLKKIYNL